MINRVREQRGQSSVELALALPFLLILVLFVVQVGLVVEARILVTHAAREGARAVAVDPGVDVEAAVLAATPLDPVRLEVEVVGSLVAGTEVTVRVRYSVATNTPLVGALMGDVEVEAQVTMLVEGG